ncbi:MAG: radical SAM protein [Proteobacteria bacterium]|jgi:MoaA/NifB/PqqE/SkfB family radical SAM enzyme|nr:radical SAM protein [Pseudomonadota bacterium]
MRCEPRAEGRYGEFARRALSTALRDRVPLSGTVEITAACNLSCSHCYIPRDIPGHRDLTADQWFGVLGQLADAGCLWLGITGGEPLLRKDFWAIYDRARDLGFLISLLTNGTLIDDEAADRLAAASPLMVEITVYGASAGTYERVTGDPRAFESVSAAVDRLVDRGIRLTLKATLTERNVDDFDAIEGMALARGLPFRFDGLINSRMDGDRAPVAERIAPELLARLEMGSPERLARWEAARDHQEMTRGMSRTAFACGAGRSSFVKARRTPSCDS